MPLTNTRQGRESSRETVEFGNPGGNDADVLVIDREVWIERATALGLTGGDNAELVERYSKMTDFQIEAEQAAFLEDHQLLTERMRQVLSDVGSTKAAHDQTVTQLEELKKDGATLKERVATLQAQLKAESHRLAQIRLQFLKQSSAKAEQAAQNAVDAAGADAQSNREAFLSEQRADYDRRKQEYEINRAEYERRARQCEEELRLIETELTKVNAVISNLREHGWTQTTAGFNVWAGYVGILGASFILVGLLDARLKGSPAPISAVLAALRGKLGTIRTLADLWLPFANFVGLILAGLCIVAAFTVLIHRYTALGSMERISRRRSRPFWAELRLPFDFLKSIFTGQPLLKFRSDRRAQDSKELGLGRRSLSRLLLFMPFVLVATFVMFFGAAFGLERGTLETQVPYVGFAIALTSSALAIVFVAGRWRRWVSAEFTSKAVIGMLYAPALLGVLLVSALLSCAILPDAPWFNRLAIALVALFLLFGSIAAAVGLIIKGIFRDRRELVDQRNLYRTLIDNYRAEPTIGAEPYLQPEELAEALQQYHIRRHMVHELAFLEHIRDRYQDDFPSVEDFSKFMKAAASASGCRLIIPPITTTLDPGTLLSHVEVPPDALDHYGSLVVQERSAGTRLAANAEFQQIGDLRAKELARRIELLLEHQAVLEDRMVQLSGSSQARTALMKARREEDLAAIADAHRAGVAARMGGESSSAPGREGEQL